MQNVYKLVISEKPSVGKSIAAVLGANERKDGYFMGSGYIVSWCFGHLAELAEAAAYDEKYAKWRYDDLPILPESWQYSVARDKGKQLALLNTLMHRADVSEVINACDAGREGESIFRTVYLLNKCDKPMKRLWISSMEDAAIRRGFETLKDGSAYDSLYASALCRSKADWLVGINATRLFSVLYHRTLNVGRVVSPTLALIVQRESEIDAFKPEPFYTVALGLPGFEAGSERMKSKADAETLSQSCTNQTAVVTKLERRDKSEKPPALYDLTTLQRDANRILGFTAQQTLDYLQTLYEKKLCTYPRTDSRYLTSDMADGLPALVNSVAAALPKVVGITIHVNAAQVINDKKVSDHHAVIPTANFKEAALTGLPAGERAVLELVALRLLCAVAQPHKYTETAVTLECAGHSFSAKGRTVTSPGWRVFTKSNEENADNSNALPSLEEGQSFKITAPSIKEGKTTPPKHYTEDTLLSAMEVAGAKEMPEDAERKGLGTPATRAAILEKLVATGFVERKKSKKTVNLIPTHAGISLITVLPEHLQSPLMPAEGEHRLKEIERGEEFPETFMQGIHDMVCELVKTYKTVLGADVLFPSGRTVVGKCPRCGSDVTESKKGYFCERNDCHFGLWRDNRFLAAKKINLTKKMAEALLKDGKTYSSGIFAGKTGKTDDCVEIAAGQTQDHTQRAAQKGQRADHDESAEHEPQGRRGTGLGFPFLRGDGHQEAAEDQTDNLRTDILHLGCRMQTDSARDITLKAGDAEAHVGRVAERRQHECCDADDNAGQNDEQILFFHVLFPPILSN